MGMEQFVATALALLAGTCAILVLKAAVVAWNLWFAIVRPEFCERIYRVYTAHPVRSGIIGAINTAVGLFAVLVMLQIKPLGLLAILLFGGICAVHLWGRIGAYRLTADRLAGAPETPLDHGAWLRAAAVTELAFLVPLVGQILYLGVTLRAAGAFVLAALGRGKPDE